MGPSLFVLSFLPYKSIPCSVFYYSAPFILIFTVVSMFSVVFFPSYSTLSRLFFSPLFFPVCPSFLFHHSFLPPFLCLPLILPHYLSVSLRTFFSVMECVMSLQLIPSLK